MLLRWDSPNFFCETRTPFHLNYSSLNAHTIPRVSFGSLCPGANWGEPASSDTNVTQSLGDGSSPSVLQDQRGNSFLSLSSVQHLFLFENYLFPGFSFPKSHFLIINLLFHDLPFHLFIAFAHLCSTFPFKKKPVTITGMAKWSNLSQYFPFSFNANPFHLPVQMKCCYFCIMSLIVWEVKKVRWRFLLSGLPAKESKGSVLMKG